MHRPTFSDRLAYARFLVHFRTGEAPSNAAIAKAAGRTGPWVTQIEDKADPPADYRVHRPMADFLGVPDQWLIHGEGAAPEPDLWARWFAQRTGEAGYAIANEGGRFGLPQAPPDTPITFDADKKSRKRRA